MSTCDSKSWADMDEWVVQTPCTYVSMASRNIKKDQVEFERPDQSGSDDSSDFSDFTTIVSKKKRDMTKKCENAVLQWAKNKGQTSKQFTKCCEDIICNRCSSPYIFTEKMKEKYAQNKWNTPKICKTCSQTRYAERKI